jgi:hypothetical protein
MSYPVFKGLEKPLVFFGLKDRYIYYALGVIVGTLIIGGIASSILGNIALLIVFVMGGIAVSYIFKVQDKIGLYKKTKNTKQIHIVNKNKFK